MIELDSQTRNKAEKLALVRGKGLVPGVLYGPKTKNQTVQVDAKEFEKAYKQAGESSLVNLKSQEGVSPVLIREVQKDPLRGRVIHVDFYQPALDEAIEVPVSLAFEGEAPAVKDLGGTLLRNIQEVEVKALPQNLPHEIAVDISVLGTFEDKILVKDLVRDASVEILREPDELVAQAVAAEDVEAELEQPVEENVEAVGAAVEKKEKEPGAAEAEEGEKPADKKSA
jgi:large subunit ribosomal protein L25